MDLITLAVQVRKGIKSIKEAADGLKDQADKFAKQFTTVDIAKLITRHRGFYAWRGIRHFLFEYEQELKHKARATRDKITWDEFSSEHYESDYETIEHIYPQRPTDQYWKTKFSSLTSKQKASLRDSLGNLVALSRPKNASLGNRSFPDKINGTTEISGYSAGSFSELEVAQYPDWTPQVILTQGIKLLKFMEKRWSFSLKDDETRIAALGLTFLCEKPNAK